MNYTNSGESTPIKNVFIAAKELIANGFAVTPVVGKTKKGKLQDWPKKLIDASEVEQVFAVNDNIAIVLGEISGGLTDIDFDHPFATHFADFLPQTEMIHGRPGNPSSHYWYRADGPLKSHQFKCAEGKVLIEIRRDGCMTMVPPSVHPDGDQLQWVKQGTPAMVDAALLSASVGRIAAATLLAIHWPQKGSRNQASLALAGTLLRGGWSVSDAAEFICKVAKVAGDEEHATRGDCTAATASKLELQEHVTGLPTLSSLMGVDVSQIANWLCLGDSSADDNQVAGIVEWLNNCHAIVCVGGGTWVLSEVIDPSTKNPEIALGRPSDLRLKYQNRKIPSQTGRAKDIVDVWLEHPKRREYDGLEFAPDNPTPGFYNLFRGFAVNPFPGECGLYLDHVHDNICNGDSVLYDYVISWMSHAIQYPGELPGTALVLRGMQGVGKGVFVENFGKLFGAHYLTLYQLGQVTGRFNSHLRNLLLVHANEAVWGGNKEAEGALKGVVTDPMMPIEAKGKDITQVRNCKRLICSSNEQWAVPLDLDDRRFLVLDVSAKHKEDYAYFGAIEKQMADGGLSALMHVLAGRDLTGFNVRKLPSTSMGLDLKLMSASPATQWWHEQLMSESTFCGGVIEKSIAYKSYTDWCGEHKKNHFSTLAIFCRDLKKLVPTLTTKKAKASSAVLPWAGERKAYFNFPSRPECRKHFEVLTKSGAEIWEA